jgi:hypothetical protein
VANRRREPPAAEQHRDGLGVHGPGEELALTFLTACFHEGTDLRGPFDALGDDIEPDHLAQVHDAAQELQPVG